MIMVIFGIQALVGGVAAAFDAECQRADGAFLDGGDQTQTAWAEGTSSAPAIFNDAGEACDASGR